MHRKTKQTRLIYCEGAADKAFLDCLRSKYSSNEYSVDIKRGAGGDQVHLVEEAYRKGQPYDEVYLKIDGDRSAEEMENAEQTARGYSIAILKTTPCVERLLINVLEPTKNVNSWNTDKCKRYFESKYIPRNKRTNTRAYSLIFSKSAIDEARTRLPELNAIVELL